MTPRRVTEQNAGQKNPGVLEEKIEHVIAALERIEARLDQIDERLRAAELTSARSETSLAGALARTEQAHTRLDEYQTRLEEFLPPAQMRSLAEKMALVEAPVRALIWLGGALGVSLIGLLWAILTHQVTILAP